MTRRLALVILSVVVTTLVLAGLGTLLLASVHARREAVDDVRANAVELAVNLEDLLQVDAEPGTVEAAQQVRLRVKALRVLRSVLDVDDLAIVATGPDGRPLTVGPLAADPLPAPLTFDDLADTTDAVGSGHRDGIAFAFAAVDGLLGRQWYVIATRDLPTVAAEGLTVFLSAAGATLVIGLVASWLLGRHLAQPLNEASTAATRIAAGDLSARLPEPAPHQRDELAVLARSVNHMADSLERSRALEQQFLLSVSHDLRTPLTSIRGYAEAIADGTGDPAASATVIRNESRRLERLVADLLDLAKLQASSFRLEPVSVDLAAAARTAVDATGPSRPGIEVRAVTSRPVSVVADPDRLAQVLANLLENAVRFAATTVVVAVEADERMATLTVDDDGPGIADDDLPHVFERLYVARRLPERRENSSGLGLAIVHELVGAMGGAVTAGAAPTGGARLSVSLPLAAP